MANTYIYPHVSISKFAKTKTRVTPIDDSAPVLLSLFTATKGPENQFVKAYDYEDFTKTYGSTVFNKSSTNPEFLCTANWLNNGGAVLGYRMTGADEKAANVRINSMESGVLFTAKNKGTYYNGFQIKISYNALGGYLYVTILNNSKEEVEGFAVTESNMNTIFEASEFINITEDGLKFIKALYDATFNKNEFNKYETVSERVGTTTINFYNEDGIVGGGSSSFNIDFQFSPINSSEIEHNLVIAIKKNAEGNIFFSEISDTEFNTAGGNTVDLIAADAKHSIKVETNDLLISKKIENLETISEKIFPAHHKTLILETVGKILGGQIVNAKDIGLVFIANASLIPTSDGDKAVIDTFGYNTSGKYLIFFNAPKGCTYATSVINATDLRKFYIDSSCLEGYKNNEEYYICNKQGDDKYYLSNNTPVYAEKQVLSDAVELTFENFAEGSEYRDVISKYPTISNATTGTKYPIVYYPSSKYYLMELGSGKDYETEIDVVNSNGEIEKLPFSYVLFSRGDDGSIEPAMGTWSESKITYDEALIIAAIGDLDNSVKLGTDTYVHAVHFKWFDSEAGAHDVYVGKTADINLGNETLLLSTNFYNISTPCIDKDTVSYFYFEDDFSDLFMIKSILKKTLEYPVDAFFDGQYHPLVKKAIIANLATLRTDCHFFFNVFYGNTNSQEVKLNRAGVQAANDMFLVGSEEGDAMYRNVSVYSQAAMITNSFTGKDQWVGPTYFLSYMTMDVDNKYGIQYPVAGLTRGTLHGVTKLTGTPYNEIKEELYQSKINYIEKDTRGYKFMCQLTRDVANTGAQYTALSYVNNSRTTERIARELEKIGRDYLFEFNDTTTLNNMQETLNAYLVGWVQNRTLSMAECFVRKNQYNENAVDISMNIKFNGTIEIISIDITID